MVSAANCLEFYMTVSSNDGFNTLAAKPLDERINEEGQLEASFEVGYVAGGQR